MDYVAQPTANLATLASLFVSAHPSTSPTTYSLFDGYTGLPPRFSLSATHLQHLTNYATPSLTPTTTYLDMTRHMPDGATYSARLPLVSTTTHMTLSAFNYKPPSSVYFGQIYPSPFVFCGDIPNRVACQDSYPRLSLPNSFKTNAQFSFIKSPATSPVATTLNTPVLTNGDSTGKTTLIPSAAYSSCTSSSCNFAFSINPNTAPIGHTFTYTLTAPSITYTPFAGASPLTLASNRTMNALTTVHNPYLIQSWPDNSFSGADPLDPNGMYVFSDDNLNNGNPNLSLLSNTTLTPQKPYWASNPSPIPSLPSSANPYSSLVAKCVNPAAHFYKYSDPVGTPNAGSHWTPLRISTPFIRFMRATDASVPSTTPGAANNYEAITTQHQTLNASWSVSGSFPAGSISGSAFFKSGNQATLYGLTGNGFSKSASPSYDISYTVAEITPTGATFSYTIPSKLYTYSVPSTWTIRSRSSLRMRVDPLTFPHPETDCNPLNGVDPSRLLFDPYYSAPPVPFISSL